MQRYKLIFITGNRSGYREVRIVPYHKTQKERCKRYRKTLESVRRGNAKRSLDTCFLTALENFGMNDFFITLTFSPKAFPLLKHIQKAYDNFIKRLQRLYSQRGTKLRYMTFWGRGDKYGNLHCHILANADVDHSEIIAKSKGIDVDVKRIRENYPGESDQNVIRRCTYYLWNHWESLEENDKLNIKKRWYSSKSLNKMEIEEFYEGVFYEDEFDNPMMMSHFMILRTLERAKSIEELNIMIETICPGYKIDKLGYNFGESAIIHYYGNKFGKLELVKIGSKLDDKVIVKNGYRVNSVTGEVYGEAREQD